MLALFNSITMGVTVLHLGSPRIYSGVRGPGWLNELQIYFFLQLIQAYHQYGVGSRPAL